MEGSRQEREPRNWTARVLAPLALVAVVVVAAALVSANLNGDEDDDDGGKDKGAATTSVEPGCNPPADAALEAGFYTMKPDEPGLSAVVARTCIPIERLEQLNPDLDPQAIAVGQCVNLRRDGCEAAG
jgi:hypothetical protein